MTSFGTLVNIFFHSSSLNAGSLGGKEGEEGMGPISFPKSGAEGITISCLGPNTGEGGIKNEGDCGISGGRGLGSLGASGCRRGQPVSGTLYLWWGYCYTVSFRT